MKEADDGGGWASGDRGTGETSALSAPLCHEPKTAPAVHYKLGEKDSLLSWNSGLTGFLSFDLLSLVILLEKHGNFKSHKSQWVPYTGHAVRLAGVRPSLTCWDTCFVKGRFRWLDTPQHWTTLLATLFPSKAEDPNFQDLMPDDLRWRWCNNRNKVHNKCKALESSPKHPPPRSMEKWSSTKLVPGAKNVEYHCSSEPQNLKENFILMSSLLNTLFLKGLQWITGFFVYVSIISITSRKPVKSETGISNLSVLPGISTWYSKKFSINAC